MLLKWTRKNNYFLHTSIVLIFTFDIFFSHLQLPRLNNPLLRTLRPLTKSTLLLHVVTRFFARTRNSGASVQTEASNALPAVFSGNAQKVARSSAIQTVSADSSELDSTISTDPSVINRSPLVYLFSVTLISNLITFLFFH